MHKKIKNHNRNKRCAVAGVVFSSDRTSVLLIQRRDVPVWVLPGGGVEVGEPPEEAVVRELLEETGFTVNIVRLVGQYTPINRLTRYTFFYECQIISGEAKTSEESRAVAFFPLKNLPLLMPPPYLEWIQEAWDQRAPFCKPLCGVTYSLLFSHCFSHPLLVMRFLLSRIGLSINI